jgi:hypothetical protein
MYRHSPIFVSLVKATPCEIEMAKEVWTKFLERINAPADLAGLFYINDFLFQIDKTPQMAKRIFKPFGVDINMLIALKFELDLHTSVQRVYRRNKVARRWYSEHPLYSLLFNFRNYKSSNSASWLLIRFIEHYIDSYDLINSPDIQPKSRGRDEEVCRAFRKLFDRNNRDISPDMLLNGEATLEECDLVKSLESLVAGISASNSNRQYLMVLLHFFKNDWEPPIARTPPKRRDPGPKKRYGRKIRQDPLPADASDLHSIQPYNSQQIDVEGIDEEDQYAAQSHVLSNALLAESRDKTSLNAIEAVRDIDLKKAFTKNISERVRKSQNTNLANINLLSPSSIIALVDLIKRFAQKQHTTTHAIALYCSLTLGKSLEELADLTVFFDRNKPENGIYIDIKSQTGYWNFIVDNPTQARKDTEGNLYEPDPWAQTPCPVFLLGMIQSQHPTRKKGKLIQLHIRELQKTLQSRLKHYSENNSEGQVSVEGIRTFAMRFMGSTNITDTVHFDFSYGNHYYTSRVSRSYASISNQTRIGQLGQFWKAVVAYCGKASLYDFLFNGLSPDLVKLIERTGSRFCVTNETCQKLSSELRSRLLEKQPSSLMPLKEIVDYHNAYVLYTAWLLAFSVGYRAVINPLPTLALHIAPFNLLAISDKDDSDFTHTRVVAVPRILGEQLIYYKNHLLKMGELLRTMCPDLCRNVDNIVLFEKKSLSITPAEVAHWFKNIRHSKQLHGPLFSLDYRLNSLPLSPKLMVDLLPQNIKIPANTGRHWLKSNLLAEGVEPELIDWQMGHWQCGQAPLGNYSTLNAVEAAKQLGPLINHFLTADGWKSCTSALL